MSCTNHDPWAEDDDDDGLTELSREELELQIKHSLDYLVAEGIVVKRGEYYRLKTEEEIEQELRDIENE
jgi:hypothetical protein